MRCLLLRLLGVIVIVLAARLVAAESPVGRWTVDEDQMRESMLALVISQLDANSVPEDQREGVLTAIRADIDRALADMRGTVEFLADGRATFTDPEGKVDTAQWTAQEDGIRIVPPAGKGDPMVGRFVDGRLHLTPEGESDAPLAIVLKRK